MKNLLVVTLCASFLFGQDLAKPDPVIKAIWDEVYDNTELEELAHELLDEIGPRLVGSPQMDKAGDWAVKKFKKWKLDNPRKEQYGKYLGWDRGITHIDLIEPRVRSLEGMMLAWSAGTDGKDVEAEAVTLPTFKDEADFKAWLPSVEGKFVLVSMLQPTGRPDENWEEFAANDDFKEMKTERDSIKKEFRKNHVRTGLADSYWSTRRPLHEALQKAGAVGIVRSNWSKGFGVNKIFSAYQEIIPTIDISLEDYGLVYRLAESGKKPKMRLNCEAKFLGAVPQFNTIAEIKGSEKPDEYVILSAHYDSWDGASGATDNGTGSITMMEIMRILKKVYPNPKRTILIGLWGSEEQGLNGSSGFVIDNPDIIKGTQAVFNQDNGTGRVSYVSGSGFENSHESLGKWLTYAPREITELFKTYNFPGTPFGGGSDHYPFVASGVPAFGMSSLSWSYWNYTWHTNRDTYDKLIFSDLKRNVILIATLAYLASEDDKFTDRTKRDISNIKRNGKPRTWPKIDEPNRRGRLDK